MNESLLRRVFAILLIAAFLFLSGAPVLAAATGTELKTIDSYSEGDLKSYELQDNIVGYDEDSGLKCPAPEALTEVKGLTFDPEFVSSTPYWIYIAAGKKEQQALINYIEKSDISKAKKKEWISFLMAVWKKYPLNYVKKDSSAVISAADSTKSYSLTKSEAKTFEEIDKMILKDMQEVAESQVSPKWGWDVHLGFMEVALETENYLNNESLNNSAIDSADDPDNWYNYPGGALVHCLEHGALYGSALGGLAPAKTGLYAHDASNYYEQHNYEEAFINLGYSSHFMADLGQPYHTPGIGMGMIWPNYDDPLSSDPKILRYHILHDKYEIFLGTFWEQAVPGGTSFKDYAASTTDAVYIIDPVLSADRHGYASYLLNTPLYFLCEWHFITNNDYNFKDSSLIVEISKQRVIATTENVRGLVRYVTGEEAPTLTITASAGEHGSISPSGDVSVIYDESQTFTITPDSGYIIDEILVNNEPKTKNPYTFSNVTKDQTISATFRQQTPPGDYWLEEVVDAYNGPNGLPSYNEEILGSDLHMYTTLGTDGWILCAFSDQLDFEDVSACTIYEYSSYIEVSTLTIDPNEYISPDYYEWNIGTGYETYLITFTRPNLINISIPGFHGGNILGAKCTVPGAKGEGVVKSGSPAIVEILGNRTSAR